MERRAIGLSLALHGMILILMLVNFNFAREYSKPPSVILHIDLNKVQISNKTNLPQRVLPVKKKPVKQQPKPKEKPREKPTAIQPKIKPVAKQQPKPTPKPQPTKPVKDAVPVSKKTVKPESKKTPVSPKKMPPKATEEENDLQSLLATVEKVRQQPVKKDNTVLNDEVADMGNTTMEGRLDQMLTVSEKDFISSKLRECWNIDGGAQNLDEIIVEIKASFNKDGSVRDVQILNKQNYSSFQSIADSAVRAVHICADKGEESPFYVLSKKYADHYGDWKEIYLKFSPINGVY